MIPHLITMMHLINGVISIALFLVSARRAGYKSLGEVVNGIHSKPL